jgi:hypothetical protein
VGSGFTHPPGLVPTAAPMLNGSGAIPAAAPPAMPPPVTVRPPPWSSALLLLASQTIASEHPTSVALVNLSSACVLLLTCKVGTSFGLRVGPR